MSTGSRLNEEFMQKLCEWKQRVFKNATLSSTLISVRVYCQIQIQIFGIVQEIVQYTGMASLITVLFFQSAMCVLYGCQTRYDAR